MGEARRRRLCAVSTAGSGGATDLSSTERCPICGGSRFAMWYDVPTVVSVDVATGLVDDVEVEPGCGAPRTHPGFVRCLNEFCDGHDVGIELGEDHPLMQAAARVGDTGSWPGFDNETPT